MDGFQWYIRDYDTLGIKFKGKFEEPIKSEFTQTTSTVFSIGAGFTEVWKFIGLKEGSFHLDFDYKNHQQTATKEYKAFIIKIE